MVVKGHSCLSQIDLMISNDYHRIGQSASGPKVVWG